MPGISHRFTAGLAFASSASIGAVRAAGPPPDAPNAKSGAQARAEEKELTPGENLRNVFRRPRGPAIVGPPVLDVTIHHRLRREVARTPEGKVALIVPYSAWFGGARADRGKRR